jgi:hypothetical protein
VAHVAPGQSWLRLLVTDGHDWADPPSFPLAGDMTRLVRITISDGNRGLTASESVAHGDCDTSSSMPTLT